GRGHGVRDRGRRVGQRLAGDDALPRRRLAAHGVQRVPGLVFPAFTGDPGHRLGAADGVGPRAEAGAAMSGRRPDRRLHGAAGALVLVALASLPARARLDIDDRGPVLDAGAFAMRVTNCGILGNAFFDVGRSFDPSLEFPRGSGHEALGHAELWVGARAGDGTLRVSGGPMLEWRPSLDSADVVHAARAGAVGSLWNVDDDRDGRIDEDPLDGRDND